jgi:hypothetical protein
MVGVGRGWAIGASSGERRRNSWKEGREEFGEGGMVELWGEGEVVRWEDVELEVS